MGIRIAAVVPLGMRCSCHLKKHTPPNMGYHAESDHCWSNSMTVRIEKLAPHVPPLKSIYSHRKLHESSGYLRLPISDPSIHVACLRFGDKPQFRLKNTHFPVLRMHIFVLRKKLG